MASASLREAAEAMERDPEHVARDRAGTPGEGETGGVGLAVELLAGDLVGRYPTTAPRPGRRTAGTGTVGTAEDCTRTATTVEYPPPSSVNSAIRR